MYLFMNKDKIVGHFETMDGSIGHSYYFEKEKDGILPIGFKNIGNWLENRKASKHNAHLKRLMYDCGCEEPEGFIAVTHAASITDTFWVKKEEESVHWDQISFYRNPFSESISRLAFEGLWLSGLKLSFALPEFSTDGSFRKCWCKEEEGIYLYKRGSSGARNSGLEPYCETMASELANAFIKESVHYDITNLHGELASKCRLFTDEKFGYVPAFKFQVNSTSAEDLKRFYEKIGSEEQYRRMLVLDAITFNVDRHAGNHGVLVNNDTQDPIRMAPVFDLNLSMLPYVEQEDFSYIGDKLEEYGPRIGDDFTRIGQQALTSDIRAGLIGLKGFKFSFRGDDRFPSWRVKAMEELVNRQIEAVLSKEILHTRDVFIPAKREEDTEPSVATDFSEQERKAEEFWKHMETTGCFSEHLLNYDEDHMELILSVSGQKDTSIYINMDTNEMWIERNGLLADLGECMLDCPDIGKAYGTAARYVDCLAERSYQQMQKDEMER